MSTRATVHFVDGGSNTTEAIVYRHGDGYPDGLGKDLKEFLRELEKNVPDPRFNDPSYLAAKWVVRDAARMAAYQPEPKHPLSFLSVGIVMKYPGDIDYRYKVICQDSGKPKIECRSVPEDLKKTIPN